MARRKKAALKKESAKKPAPRSPATKAAAKKAPKPRGVQKKQITMHYKRASFLPPLPGNETLASLFELAMAPSPTPFERMERVNDAADTVRLINKCYSEKKVICGRFLDYTEGGASAALEIIEGADELKIKTLKPLEKEQYLEGIVTFGIDGNHVMPVQSKALKVGHFENHLNYVLRTLTKVLPDAHRVFLKDEPARRLKKQLQNVSSIQLSEPVPGANFITGPAEKSTRGFDPILAGLREMLPTIREMFGNKLTPDQALALEDIEVSIKLSRKRKSGGQSVIDDIAHVLRHVEDIDVIIRAGGTVFRTDDLKVTATRSIETESGGILKLSDAEVVMERWLTLLLSTDRVAA